MTLNNSYINLKQKILEIIENQGDIGIFASHPNSGYGFTYNGEKKFEMASIYNLPIAIHCLKLVEAAKLDLEQNITISPRDQRPGTDLAKPLILTEEDRKNYSLKELLKLMMQYSDNTATDIILHLIGGPKAVMKTIEAIGIRDLRVDHSIYKFLTQQIGASHLISREDFTIAKFNEIEKSMTTEQLDVASLKYEKAGNDTATPRAIGTLLTKLVQGKILNKSSTKILLDFMAACKTFPKHISGLLPEDLVICRKTASISHIANDVAIIDLPNGPFILVIFCCHLHNKNSEEKDRLIALIAKAVYDDLIGIDKTHAPEPLTKQ
jgi:beta-lactamase class A